MSTPDVLGQSIDRAESQIKNNGLKVRIVGNGTEVLKQVPGSGEAISKDGTVVLITDEQSAEQTVTVPDLIGKTVNEVNSALVNAGLNVSLSGSDLSSGEAICYRQSIEAGEQVAPGTIVTADFRYSMVDDA